MEERTLKVGEELVIPGVALLTLLAVEGDDVVLGLALADPQAEEALAAREAQGRAAE